MHQSVENRPTIAPAVDGNISGYGGAMSDWPPRLTVDIEPVLRLFTGENFYSSADAALREAVLNAIDAIGRRRVTEPDLQQQIEVIFDRTKMTITVSDNGDGMDRQDVANLFTKVGATAAQLARGEAKGYRAIGEFGIGALSYFLVSDEYHVQTKKAGCEACGLMFSAKMLDGRSQAQEVTVERSDVGTTLILFAKTPALFEQLLSRFAHWMRNVGGLRARVFRMSQT
jgi:HSP90 family molecular chaperone